MTKHTPGPWKLVTSEQDRNFQIVGADSIPVAVLHTTTSSLCAKWSDKRIKAKTIFESVANEREQANAALIAAAPDLLGALQELVEYLSDTDEEGLIEHSPTMVAARAAIAKATGGTP